MIAKLSPTYILIASLLWGTPSQAEQLRSASAFDVYAEEKFREYVRAQEPDDRARIVAELVEGIGKTNLDELTDAVLTDTFWPVSNLLTYNHVELDNEFRAIVAELDRRELLTGQVAQAVYQTLVYDRQWAAAADFEAEYTVTRLEGWQAVERAEASGKEPDVFKERRLIVRSPAGLTVETLDLAAFTGVVAIVGQRCAFSQAAARDIADAGLSAEVEEHVRLILPHTQPFTEIRPLDWPADTEADPAMGYHADEWSEIEHWGTPSFYAYKDGTLIDQMIGWHPNETAGNLVKFESLLDQVSPK